MSRQHHQTTTTTTLHAFLPFPLLSLTSLYPPCLALMCSPELSLPPLLKKNPKAYTSAQFIPTAGFFHKPKKKRKNSTPMKEKKCRYTLFHNQSPPRVEGRVGVSTWQDQAKDLSRMHAPLFPLTTTTVNTFLKGGSCCNRSGKGNP